MRWAGHVTRMREMTGSYKIFVGKPERNRSFQMLRFRLEDNIKMDLEE
jgi:hypothetical protein